ncbi:MAG: flagellar basal body P-ring protein FlgI [Planctomycetota bacterium]
MTLPTQSSSPIRRRQTPWAAIGLAAAILASAALPGCNQTKKIDRAPGAAPAPTYSGPPFLRNTIGSLCTLNGFTPTYASGIGIVVNLDGTGSPQVPAPLRQQIVNDLRKRGVGSVRSLDTGFPMVTPGQLLDSENTALVAVQGLIPAGATKNTRFDVLVSALPQTQTSSLQGGLLMPLDMTAIGAESPASFMPKLADARGDIYLNPFDEENAQTQDTTFLRQGIVLRGGRVAEDQPLELLLNQPSWARSRTIANRINERFGLTEDRRAIAEPKTDRSIAIFIPPRYADDPSELVNLISYVYLGGGPGFETTMATQLVEVARRRPSDRGEVGMAWKALGKSVLPVIRPLYEDEDIGLAIAALSAGAFLEDERSSDRLSRLAERDDKALKLRVAVILSQLPNSLRGSSTLGKLASDPDPDVRVAAYEAMVATGDTQVRRLPIRDETDRIKYVIDRVRSDQPLVYARITSTPTLAIFDGGDIGLTESNVARAWGNRVMVRGSAENAPWEVFFAPSDNITPQTFAIFPSYSTLAYFLGHRPSIRDPQDGLDLTFSRVVDVLYEFSRRGYVNAPMRFELSGLAAAIGVYEEQAREIGSPRPETAEDDPAFLDADVTPRPDTSDDAETQTEPQDAQQPASDAVRQLSTDAFPKAPSGASGGGRPESSR